jgi:hypothetical protein
MMDADLLLPTFAHEGDEEVPPYAAEDGVSGRQLMHGAAHDAVDREVVHLHRQQREEEEDEAVGMWGGKGWRPEARLAQAEAVNRRACVQEEIHHNAIHDSPEPRLPIRDPALLARAPHSARQEHNSHREGRYRPAERVVDTEPSPCHILNVAVP